jgi:RHS repeat-associated protein
MLGMKNSLQLVVLVVLTAPVHLEAMGALKGPFPPPPAVSAVQPPSPRVRDSSSQTIEEISRARIFEEPLVPIGGEPSLAENAALTQALVGYAQRTGPDDYSSLTTFLESHPQSAWRAALLVNLGIEYYNTARYSRALEAWRQAWELGQRAADGQGKALADRAAGELAYLYARLGRMNDLGALLGAAQGRVFVGRATELITGARESLWSMEHRPEVSFRCGPLALQSIKLSQDPNAPVELEIVRSASTRNGFSLPQVAELSKRVGLNYQMAFRGTGGHLVVPSVVHWKVGHYAALVRQEGDRYLLQDPTFGNEAWATRQALEDETSGYFLVPSGALPPGWRAVDAVEGSTVWGKGVTTGHDPKPHGPGDPKKPDCNNSARGMAVANVHLMMANLNLTDEPVGYAPPVGPAVRFTVTYNHREAFQPANFNYSNLGPKWTCNWISYITDNPQTPQANVDYYIRGGGTRTFTGFNPTTQTFAPQQFDLTQLKRTGSNSYEMVWADGSKLVFAQPNGAIGTARKVFLTQVVDPAGNAVTLSYDGLLRLVSVTDAIGQVTTISYAEGDNPYLIRRVTDPFGRFATFEYTLRDIVGGAQVLSAITDVIGITSRFVYQPLSDTIAQLITPYGTNTFLIGQGGGPGGTTRYVETHYPDGSRDRVECNQSPNLGLPESEPASVVPAGMPIVNGFLQGRNTFYWSRTACASSYGDYTKARVYHWMHAPDNVSTSGFLESVKEPLENRLWYSRGGNGSFSTANTLNRYTQVGRVLEDGQTQMYRYAYNGFGLLTNAVDPVGRTFTYIYATNGIDLLEVRQTRGGQNELLSRATYNDQHLPLTMTDAAGQTTTFTYNGRGQLLTRTNPKGETVRYDYDSNGYLVAVDGPLPGTNDLQTATHDAFGRTRTRTDESGYNVTLEYDNLDRLTRITHPDGTFSQFTFERLDLVSVLDRAGRVTTFEYDELGQTKQRTDPLGRTTRYEWCRCGDVKSLTDALGRTTLWTTDVQGRPAAKIYADGSRVQYVYEGASARLRQVIDERGQLTQFSYNLDDTLQSVIYGNSAVPTPGVTYTYDTNYVRLTSMSDGLGTTRYAYHPILPVPTPGAGQLASEDGPLPNDTITYDYDELGRVIRRSIGGVASTNTFDAAGRITGKSNVLGAFIHSYDGASRRMSARMLPNAQVEEREYLGVLQDLELQRITHRRGAEPISEFVYGHDQAADRITSWSQRTSALEPLVHGITYDAADQLAGVSVTNAGALVGSFGYTYDLLGNRLTETVHGTTRTASYNALNQLSTSSGPGLERRLEWDVKERLVAVTAGNDRTEFTYDGLDRLVVVRRLVNGVEGSVRRLLWCGNEICEERDAAGAVTKRFFAEGMRVETGADVGDYYYTRDHLGSVRELTDSSGGVRARYAYAPWGRPNRFAGDLEADFGFAGMFWSVETGLYITRFRAYDPDIGRWLSRDPLPDAERQEGPNLYTYVQNDSFNKVDRLGLMPDDLRTYEIIHFERLSQERMRERDQQRIARKPACCGEEVLELERWSDACREVEITCPGFMMAPGSKIVQRCYAQKDLCRESHGQIQAWIREIAKCLERNTCRPCILGGVSARAEGSVP